MSPARAMWRTCGESPEHYTFGGACIPGYRRIRQLASGPVADLYLAQDEMAERSVVLKVARDQCTDNDLDDSFQRFLQEYEITRAIQHPGIVQLYDLGVCDEHVYLSMEYFPRGDLRRRMRTNGVTPDEALHFTARIAEALHAVHAAGVLHRDVKPGNVMMREEEGVALIDFGLAKQAALEIDLTDQGMIFGTPHYMSPEQGHGEPIDGRSDLYSLGVVLFEMLTGNKPFTADNPMAVVYKHRKEPIPRLPEALAPYQDLIDRMMAKGPGERFASGAAVAAEIARLRGLETSGLGTP